LLTALLVLAIVASSALVFTNRVELLKLAVIVALWAAVVAAFVSFIYRRQSDMDQAKARDLKLVYDLQLDREISARREYELSVESQLRRELASEMRAQSSDEVASLRAELAALRANLEILFGTDLQHRPAIETERTSVHTFPDWSVQPDDVAGQERGDRGNVPGRVISSRLDTEDSDDTDPNTEESPIIDVPVEPSPPEHEWGPPADPGGAHRRASEAAQSGWQPQPPPAPRPAPEPDVRFPWPPPEPAPTQAPPPQPQREPVARSQWQEPEQPGWRPAPAEGLFIPAGTPGSNWTSPVTENGSAAHPPTPEPTSPPEPAMAPAPAPEHNPTPPPVPPPAAEGPRGRHATSGSTAEESALGARHSALGDADAGRRGAPPTLATSPPPAPAQAATPPPPPPAQPTPSESAARHRGGEEPEPAAGQHIGGQPLSELLARLQVTTTEGGRRRRREE
jgi:hypothetical protein